MIDRLNERLATLCGGNNPGGAFPNAWQVDARGAVGTLWADELHPTDEGYGLVAARFAAVLGRAFGR
jgi:lysophospholipase L1-like esterase